MTHKHSIVCALLVIGVLYLVWVAYCGALPKKRIVPLVGYSTDSSKALPSAPAGESHTMGMNIQAR